MLGTELGFNFIYNIPSTVPTKNYIVLWVFLFIFSFIKNTFWRRLAMNLLYFLSLFQMVHILFYGIPVYPNAIYLFFTESSEVFYTLFENITILIYPVLSVVVGIGVILYIDKKTKEKRIKVPYLYFLFIVYFSYNPLRTYTTGNTWGRQPSVEEFMGTNIYLASSYFLGRILPYKLTQKKSISQRKPLTFEKIEPFKGNIILVLGESLSSNHMSLFGYKKETTPYLKSLNENFIYHKGISSGVSTDVAVALFMNNTYGLDGSRDILSGKSCLFSMAKNNGFKTYFYSSQSQQQLRYISASICPKSIDHYLTLEDLEPSITNPNMASDQNLLKPLRNIPDESGNFIILHQRGSHSPYKLRYQKEYFSLTGEYEKDRVIHYDNSVYEFDLFMKELIEEVKTKQTPTLVIYISDHGEGLGEEGLWGHAALKKPSFEIPALFYLHKLESNIEDLPKLLTHLNVSLLISKYLGYQTSISASDVIENYQILGNDLDGFAGYLDLELSNEKIKKMKETQI